MKVGEDLPAADPAQARKLRRQRKRAIKKRLSLLPLPLFLFFCVAAALFLFLRSADDRVVPVAPPDSGPPYTVALDAGHGGRDQGAVGLIPEVELTEKTVSYLYALLSADPDFTPILCRENGAGASIEDRIRVLSDAGALLLLSVHGNADPSATASGFECFPAPPGRRWHEDSLRFATLLVEEMASAGSVIRGVNGIKFAYFDALNQRFFRETDDLAVYVEKSFALLEQPDCPAVLAEQCFLTNPADVAAFGTDEGCRKAAEAYHRAIRAYFELDGPDEPDASDEPGEQDEQEEPDEPREPGASDAD
jgi:N-acetylmuramoyl-L-alanine amidase